MHTAQSGRTEWGRRCRLAAEQGRAMPHRHYDRVNDPSMAAVAHVRELGVVGKTKAERAPCRSGNHNRNLISTYARPGGLPPEHGTLIEQLWKPDRSQPGCCAAITGTRSWPAATGVPRLKPTPFMHARSR
jgi:hypothetical protein